jgi:parallel beta-helix repeat protein
MKTSCFVLALLGWLSCATVRAGSASGPEATAGLYAWYRADGIAGLKDGDVVARWDDSGPRKLHLDQHAGSPVLVSRAFGNAPAIRFREGPTDGLRTSAPLAALAGDPSFTIFVVAKVSKPNAARVQPLGWGDGSIRGAGMFLEFESGRLDLGTGWCADASTPDQSYADHFGKPTIIMAARSPGPMHRSTQISFDGIPIPVSGSGITPQVRRTPLNLGGDSSVGYVSPAMEIAEIVLFDRRLGLAEQNHVGYYLQEKYGIRGQFVRPDQFAAVELEIRAEPRDVAATAGFTDRREHRRGSRVAVMAERTILLRGDDDARAFAFDHWQGEVTDSRLSRTTVFMDQPKTIIAVYREEKLEFYVAPNGRDAWSGSQPEPNAAGTDGPFATLTQARDAVRQLKTKSRGTLSCPVRVFLRTGRYPLAEPIVLGTKDSGTPDFRITYAAYPGENPILSGGRSITGWKPYQGKIIQCTVPGSEAGKWKFRQLFYNGKNQIRARTPNFDPQDPLKGGWATMEGPAEPGSQTAFRYKQGTLVRRWAKPAEAEVNVFIGFDWANNIIPIKAIDEQRRLIALSRSTTRFTNPPSPLPYNFPTPFNPNQRFRVENVLEELDQPGEWCWDSEDGKLYFWPPDGAVEKSEVVAPRLDTLLVLRGAAHVTVSGLTLAETNGGDNFHPEGVEGVGAMFPMPGWKYCGDAVLLDGAQDCRIEHNRFVNIGGNAIYLKGPSARNRISGNEISGVGACGVCLAGAEAKEAYPVFNEIVDNRIDQTGTMNMYSAAIFLGMSEGNVVGHNSIRRVPHHAINLGNTGRSRNIVEYNEIRDTCLETSDTGAINCWMEHDARNEPRQGHIIRYNLVVDSRERGIYLDNYTSNCSVYGNIVVRAPLMGLIVHGGKNNVIENNVLVGCGQAVAYYDGIDELMPRMARFSSGNRFCRNIVSSARELVYVAHKRPERVLAQSDHNLLFDVGDASTYLETRRREGYEVHSRIADPKFVDPAKDDYRLKPESPAIELGFQPIDIGQIGPRAGASRKERAVTKPAG